MQDGWIDCGEKGEVWKVRGRTVGNRKRGGWDGCKFHMNLIHHGDVMYKRIKKWEKSQHTRDSLRVDHNHDTFYLD